LPRGALIQGISETQIKEAEDCIDENWWKEASNIAEQHEHAATPEHSTNTNADFPSVGTAAPSLCEHQGTQRGLSPGPDRVAKVSDDGFGGALISIGPHTDAIFDRFHLNDILIPQLRILATTVRSSKWEAVLRSTKWGLNYEQAVNLSRAMAADIKNEPFVQIKVHN